MARPRKKVPQDSSEIIEYRRLNRPADESAVLAKTHGGAVVLTLSGRKHKWPDGVERPYAPWPDPVDDELQDGLVPGIAETKVFRWVNQRSDWMLRQRGLPRWRPVKKSDNWVHCPYALGDNTDDHFHRTDTMLHWREMAFHEKVQKARAFIHSTERIVRDAEQRLGEGLEDAQRTAKVRPKGTKVKTEPVTVEADEDGAIVFPGPTD